MLIATCDKCKKQVNVRHIQGDDLYKSDEGWEYDIYGLYSLCPTCFKLFYEMERQIKIQQLTEICEQAKQWIKS